MSEAAYSTRNSWAITTRPDVWGNNAKGGIILGVDVRLASRGRRQYDHLSSFESSPPLLSTENAVKAIKT